MSPATSAHPWQRQGRPTHIPLILVGRAAADANPADMDFVRGHDSQSAGKRDDSWNLADARGNPERSVTFSV